MPKKMTIEEAALLAALAKAEVPQEPEPEPEPEPEARMTVTVEATDQSYNVNTSQILPLSKAVEAIKNFMQ